MNPSATGGLGSPSGLFGGFVFSMARYRTANRGVGVLVGGFQLRTSYYSASSLVYSEVDALTLTLTLTLTLARQRAPKLTGRGAGQDLLAIPLRPFNASTWLPKVRCVHAIETGVCLVHSTD